VSVGGLAVAAARMAIAAGVGARIAVDGEMPTAALFGERGGRVIVGVDAVHAARLRSALADASVCGRRIGEADGDALTLAAGSLPPIVAELTILGTAWRSAF
jgi:phosphoribosylformylglycinamidine synthase subunit PurL